MQFFYKRSSSPISMSLLYFSTRSPLDGPTLMKLEFTATAKSTMKVSFVSPPPLWLTIVSILFFLASMQQSTVSVRVPIWFSLISIAFIALSFIAFSSLFMFVTVRSSPMIFILLPNFLVISVQLSQSSSAKGSSRVMRLYFFAQFSKYLIISDDDNSFFSLLSIYFPPEKISEAAASWLIPTSFMPDFLIASVIIFNGSSLSGMPDGANAPSLPTFVLYLLLLRTSLTAR